MPAIHTSNSIALIVLHYAILTCWCVSLPWILILCARPLPHVPTFNSIETKPFWLMIIIMQPCVIVAMSLPLAFLLTQSIPFLPSSLSPGAAGPLGTCPLMLPSFALRWWCPSWSFWWLPHDYPVTQLTQVPNSPSSPAGVHSPRWGSPVWKVEIREWSSARLFEMKTLLHVVPVYIPAPH